jgi:DNA polymerase (family 10)
MDKRAVADVLEEIGTLLELKGENVFKTRAYQNGARLLLALDEDLGTLVAEKRLREIKGIGEALADKITELVTTGKLRYYEELKAEFPAGFMELLRIPGLGPKKAKLLLDELGIKSVDELEAAARANKLADLPGMGAKSQEKILEGIAHIRKSADRFMVSVGESEAAPIVAALRELPQVKRLSVAGSLRRRAETIKDIDIVVATDDPAPVMDCFVGLPHVEAVTGHGPTKSSVRLKSGVAADLRCVSDAEYPFALMYFTGSKAHNVAIRGRAVKMGLRLNEYGSTRRSRSTGQAQVGGLPGRGGHLQDAGPRLRGARAARGHGRIAAAESGALPELITEKEIRGLLHQHTNWSDGSNTLEEMAQAAIDLGLEYFGITDHSQVAQYARGLQPERVRQQHEAIDALKQKLGDRITLLKGIECDILTDGSLDYSDDILATFDYVVISVHSQFVERGRPDEAHDQGRLEPVRADPGPPTGRLLLSRDPTP